MAQGDAVSRRIARRPKAPSDMRRVGAHMNYPYVVPWTCGYGRESFQPHCPMLFAYGARTLFMLHSASWLEALQERPGNEVLELQTGHWVSAAGELHAALLRWLDRMPAPTAMRPRRTV
jgi:cis-3-alkyl-4-acyloxetan-2-one decarboxylase